MRYTKWCKGRFYRNASLQYVTENEERKSGKVRPRVLVKSQGFSPFHSVGSSNE